MIIKNILIKNFRNLEDLELSPGAGINVICGLNAQGKTNLIEAIWLFSGQKSFRGARDNELIRFERPSSSIKAEFIGEQREETAEMVLGQNRKTLLNGIKCDSQVKLCGEFPMIVFSPIHLSLIKDGPALRRRFLDQAIGQLFPSYNEALSYYTKVLFQRNALLRDTPGHGKLMDTLCVWDENLAKSGAQIIRLRHRYISNIKMSAGEIYQKISGGREEFNVEYNCSVQGVTGESEIAEIKELFLKSLSESRHDDIRRLSTTVGAHHDDLSVTVEKRSARLYASQGQQRSSVLALKLAECAMLQKTLGISPIVLLDDVMSELDKYRKDCLYSYIENKQVFVTGCDIKEFENIKNCKTFIIEKGRLSS